MTKSNGLGTQILFGRLRQHRGWIVGVLILFAVAYAVIGQLAFVNFDWREIANYPLPVILSGACLLISYGAASGIYCLLTIGQLKYSTTYLVQMAASFASRVVPAGLGSVGVNYLYLRRHGYARAQSGTIVAVNNLLGLVGNILLLLFVLLALPISGGIFELPKTSASWGAALGVSLLLVLIVAWRRRRSFVKGLHQIIDQLNKYRKAPSRLMLALMLSLVITTCYFVILWFSAQAVGIYISPALALLAMTVGAGAIGITPTPGGLGGVEAGVVAVLTVGGLGVSEALAVALVFRVFTFWLPLTIGSVAFILALRLKLLQ